MLVDQDDCLIRKSRRPGMRERLVLQGKSTLSDNFWHLYLKKFRFYWPGDLENAFQFDGRTKKYRLSGELRNRLRDLHHWRMDLEFFKYYPCFSDDILPSQTIPQYVGLWTTSQHQRRRQASGVQGERKRVQSHKRLPLFAEDLYQC